MHVHRRKSQRRRPVAPGRAGLTLFEVVLSIAIFLMAMAAIGELIRLGSRASVQARLRTEAVMRCESKLSEVVIGVLPLNDAGGAYPDDANWTWNLTVVASDVENLKLVTVTAVRTAPDGTIESMFSLKRLIRDPVIFEQAAEAEAEAAQQQSSSGTSGGTSP